jgi:hypothetical protein
VPWSADEPVRPDQTASDRDHVCHIGTEDGQSEYRT